MPRTVRDTGLENRTARSRLKARNKPYYRALEPGLHLGYRKPLAGPGRWLARHYIGEQSYELETIGTADDFSDADGVAILNYGQAQVLARQHMVTRAHAAAGRGSYTVEDALNDYLHHLESNDRSSAKGARYRAEALILPKLGHIELAKLTTEQLRTWLADIANAPSRAWTRSPVAADDAEGQAPPPRIGQSGLRDPPGGAESGMAGREGVDGYGMAPRRAVREDQPRPYGLPLDRGGAPSDQRRRSRFPADGAGRAGYWRRDMASCADLSCRTSIPTPVALPSG